MRAIHKRWQNRRPGWTRRVTWYRGIIVNGRENIRLQFEDEFGKCHRFYTTSESAQSAYDSFIVEEFTTVDAPEYLQNA